MDEHEITIDEFTQAVGPLTSEALQVVATALRLAAVTHSADDPHLWLARNICRRMAAATRVLN